MNAVNKNSCSSYDSHKSCIVFNYLIVTAAVSLLLFLYGFFPINYNEINVASEKDIPTFVNETRIKTNEVYKPVIRRLIIMVIDALRWDFVAGLKSNENLPKTKNLLKRPESSCLYKTRVHPPTVTLPRLKSMTTGEVPNFVDVILNFGAKKVRGDSILRQSKNKGYKQVFYGDETWLKLFPDSFDRFEGTGSFFISDYTEVDLNVTRNIPIELERNDWTIMILHYLGLDHIGHLAGSRSPLIKTKLREMDEIIATIESQVSEWNNKGESTLFLMCGDHGMQDSGSHGGSSLEETLVPLVAFGQPCESVKNLDEEISQIDIAPTLAVLLGVPIPFASSGALISGLIIGMDVSQKLFALHYNARQLFVHYRKTSGYRYTETYKRYEKAIKLYNDWLNSDNSDDSGNKIISMYESVILEMKNDLTSNVFRYDIDVITIAVIFMFQILYLMTVLNKSTIFSFKRFFIVLIATSSIWMFLYWLLNSETKPIVLPQGLDLHFFLITLPISLILLLNSYLFASYSLPIDGIKSFLKKLNNLTKLRIFLLVATFTQTLSLISSSFVEEEHQVWYYYFISVLLIFAFDASQKKVESKSSYLLIRLLLIIIAQRVLRELNSTGYRYGNLPDLSDWLLNQKSKIGITLILITGLALLVILDYFYEQPKMRPPVLILNALIAVLIYLRHATTDVVLKPNFYNESRGITEVRIFWIFMIIYLIFSIYRLKITKSNDRLNSWLLLYLPTKKIVIISCLLHRPYNVILLPLQLIVGTVIRDLTKSKDHDNKIYLYIWISNAFYFYQGNSNSLSTIDLGAGYVGLETYFPVIVGIFLNINIYCATIIGLLMYLCHYAYDNPSMTTRSLSMLCKQYLFWRLVPTTVFMVLMVVHRYHGSVWTVFSPKLLYEASHCGVFFLVIFVLEIIFLTRRWLSRPGLVMLMVSF